MRISIWLRGAVAALVVVGGIYYFKSRSSAPAAPPVATPQARARAGQFAPPPDSAIPNDEFGREVRRGKQIFEQTGVYAGQYTGNVLNCSNCHLDAGRLANSAPLWAAYVSYPAYRSKNKHVNTFEERMQGCFRFSMNGKAPPLGDSVLVAVESYAYWLSTGARVNEAIAGRGYPPVPKPALAPDYARGGAVFAQHCAVCHGPDGQGQRAAGVQVFPPLWGPESFNWGAGMATVTNAAAFIRANMPLGLGGTLSDQDAWDVAMFMDGHERPQDPRFKGTVAQTRAQHHDSPMDLYGTTVNGVLLGEHSVPAGGSTRR
ncbi:MAG: c-type cytochrome [Gemmatimonadaceae bacterium]